jgi:integrase
MISGDTFGDTSEPKSVMRGKITKRAVDALLSGEVLWDSEAKGFGVKRHKDGGATYLLRYRAGSGRGAPIKTVTIGRQGSPWTPDTARAKAIALMGRVEEGADPAAAIAELRAAPTVAELAQRFRAEHVDAKRKARTSTEYGRLLDKIIIPELGKKKAADVTRADIGKLHHGLRATPYQANRVLAVVSKMLTLAEKWGLRPDGTNPCRHVEKFRETQRERMLSADELSALGTALRAAEDRWATAQPLNVELTLRRQERALARTRPERETAKAAISAIQKQLEDLTPIISPEAIAAIRLLIFTGARLNEILTLEWGWISEDGTVARLPDSKSGAKTLHFPPPAMEIIDAIPPTEGNPYVIVGAKVDAHLVNLEKPWRSIREAAGLNDLRLHDLRHAFASIAASSGMGLPIIGRLLGHQTQATTQRYAHIASDPAKAAATSIGNKIAGAMSKHSAEVKSLNKSS